MATLILTTVGSLVGGPIGGAIGAALGSQLDRGLLAPSRKGPRLGDLTVQTSSYGSALPKIFGTMRVAGTVIWATDLREDAHRSGSKAGKTTTYSYSASLAVALSARPIRGVGRIWADGKLLRGADGGFRSETGFRLYTGTEDQPIDPLIAAAQGIAATPANRGLAYAVFETLQLADFGNRVPSLSFEVLADDGPVPIARIAATLSDGALGGADGAALDGYAASGDSVRGAIEALAAAVPMRLRDDGTRLEIEAAAIAAIGEDGLGTAAAGKTAPRIERERRSAAALPDEVALSYYEPARDWQAGLQRARRDGIGGRTSRIELPAALSADRAKGLAEAALARAWTGRETATLHLPWRYADARAGGLVRLSDPDLSGSGLSGRDWRITRWTLEAMAVSLELAPEGPAATAMAAAPGAAIGSDPGAIGTTMLRVVDLPLLGDGDPGTPQLFAAAAGTGPGWRRADLGLSLDQGASWTAAGRTALPATMGTAIDALPPGPAELFDERASVTVDLLHDGMALAGADRTALIAGANLALIGDELVQFGRAEQTGVRRWRLSRLLRGRRGSEAAIAGHAAGDPFLLIEAATLRPLDVPLAALGTTIAVSAIGPGDPEPVMRAIAVVGRAVRPPAPVRLAARRLGDGTIRLSWSRRGRTGWTWLDGADVPLAEDGERYRLTLGAAPGGTARTIELDASGYDYPPAEQATDGITGAIAISVAQLGSRGASIPPATGIFAA